MTWVNNLLESIRLTESQNFDSLSLTKFLRRSFIWKTSDLVNPKLIVTDVPFKEFKPSMVLKTFIASLLILFFILIIKSARITQTDILYILSFLLIIYLLAKQFFLVALDKSRNYKIIIDQEGIKAANIEYEWRDIRETAILYLPIRRDGTYFLILIFNDDTYKKFDLTNFRSFGGFKNKISTFIEYFKSISR